MSEMADHVNVYLIDQETKRKLLFKINPLMLGKPENTTVMFPNGVEYKLVETEPSDIVKISRWFDLNECVFQMASEEFPEYGYADSPNPTRDDQITALVAAIKDFWNNYEELTCDEVQQKINSDFKVIWEKGEQKEVVHDIAFQKFVQWITENRTMVQARQAMEAKYLDKCFTLDYLKRMKRDFSEIYKEATAESTEMTFIEAIQKISTIFADMNMDFRRQSGKDWIMETIHYYEPVQVMFKPVIETIVKLHREGTNIKLNELVDENTEKDIFAVDATFWENFKTAIKQCEVAIDLKQKQVDELMDVCKDLPDEKFNRVVLEDITDTLDTFKEEYLKFGDEMAKISAGKSDKDVNEVVQTMFKKHMGNLVKELDQININIVTFYKGDAELIDKYACNQLYFTICEGIPLMIKHNQNPVTQLINSIHDLVKQFKDQLAEATKNPDNFKLC